MPGALVTLRGTGFCGALTTYSTFSFETLRLMEQKAYFHAAMDVIVSVIAGLGAALLTYTTVHSVVS
ncbi:CrcB family protein [Kibdelosporangium aridum]|uniref:fluoride efflux transporter FluC n=1 Tax=Kibdelosporangium aridum TaxID=2030 RepID=UPI000B2C9016|nr:CrcB family protein [Kibdelosporangium aridum]